MHQPIPGLIVAVGLFVGMVFLIELGRHHGNRRAARDEEKARAGLGAVEGAIFGLMGLLIAFTFSGAASRFDTRRELITQEANSIGTAWLRLDLLTADAQPGLRDLFRKYLDARLAVYASMPDLESAKMQLERAGTLQRAIWDQAVAVSKGNQSLTVALLPALNQMFDISTTRTMAARTHAPRVIFLMLGLLTLLSSLLAGYGMAGARSQSWVHIIGFAAIMSLTVYVILDLEFPRLGFIRVDKADIVLVELQQTINK